MANVMTSMNNMQNIHIPKAKTHRNKLVKRQLIEKICSLYVYVRSSHSSDGNAHVRCFENDTTWHQNMFDVNVNDTLNAAHSYYSLSINSQSRLVWSFRHLRKIDAEKCVIYVNISPFEIHCYRFFSFGMP